MRKSLSKNIILKEAGVLLIAVFMVLSTVMIVAGNASTETLTWNIETVDSTGWVGRYTSIALDTSNNPHISYIDWEHLDLKYAYYDGSWHTETVDSTGDVGKCTSIALDTSNNPHISYYDVTNRDLRYAYYDGSWHTETVDSTDDFGRFNSIALDTSNNPHISYYDHTHADLKYAYYDGSWHTETVDSTGIVGWHTSIALDSSNNPHISYGDDTNNDLKYAYYDGSWNIETADSTGVGEFNSIALDSSNNPHISYQHYSPSDLRYAYYDGSWHTTTVDSTGIVGAYTSIALDSSNNPHISYHDVTNRDLKYAYYDGSWYTETVDSTGNVGQFNSIALDSSNNPHISYLYLDATNTALKYATTAAANNPPNTPSTPTGPATGFTGVQYQYTTSTTDPDPGDTIKYGWDFNNDGIVDPGHWIDYLASGVPCTVSVTFNSPGTYYLSVIAEDNNGAQSAFSPALTVTISTANNPPNAIIDSINPNPATQGQTVTFTGHGTDPDQGDTITAYNWRSDLDGPLSTSATFSSSTLSIGTHTIYFKVQDNHGAWSTEVSQILTINPTSNNPPNQPTTPTGQSTSCKVNTPYPYSTSATDQDPGDKIKYGWDWNSDGAVDKWDDNNGNYYIPGTPITTQITWTTKQTTYSLRVIAEDLNGAQSPWSLPLSVTTPKNKVIKHLITSKNKVINPSLTLQNKAINTPFFNFLQSFFELHPNTFPILRQILPQCSGL